MVTISIIWQKSHSVLSLKVIFSDLLADNLMFFNFLESKELETSCFAKWFVTQSLESFTLSLVSPICHFVICLASWGFYTPRQCTLLILGNVWKIYLPFRMWEMEICECEIGKDKIRFLLRRISFRREWRQKWVFQTQCL